MLSHGENPNVAFTLAQTARKGLPNLPNSADTLGWAYYNAGRLRGGDRSLLQDSDQRRSQEPELSLPPGNGLRKSKIITPMAKQQFQDALQINPNFSEAGRCPGKC